MISILTIDDHPVVRAGYRHLLDTTDDLKVVAEQGNGKEGYLAYKQYNPDVVIMDLSMEGMGGLETTRRIVQCDPKAKIIVISVYESDILVRRALKAGAIGYISKRCVAKAMVEAIRRVVAGETQVIICALLPERIFDTGDKENQGLNRLTRREFEVFRMLAEGLSVTDIAVTLNISRNTAGVHYSRIMNKLKLENTVQLARFALRSGVVKL